MRMDNRTTVLAETLVKRLLEGADDIPTPAQTDTTPEREVEPVLSEPEAADELNPDAQPLVNDLASQWKSGSRQSVAEYLMFSGASYADFCRLCFKIGLNDSVALGKILDQIADGIKQEKHLDTSRINKAELTQNDQTPE